MIFAHEANKKTTKLIEDNMTTEIEEIEKRINSCILEGKYILSCSGYISEKTKKCLKQHGYKVETGSQYNKSYYTISWN